MQNDIMHSLEFKIPSMRSKIQSNKLKVAQLFQERVFSGLKALLANIDLQQRLRGDYLRIEYTVCLLN
jgi:hypothetical protein